MDQKKSKMLDILRHGDFAGQVNTKFRVVETDEPLELELVEANEINISGNQEIFSLVFLGPDDKFLPQKLYDLEHDTLGRGLIFLVPVGKVERGFSYEAVFNRMKKD